MEETTRPLASQPLVEQFLSTLDLDDILSGRRALYVRAEAKRDMPIRWQQFENGVLVSDRTMTAAEYRAERAARRQA